MLRNEKPRMTEDGIPSMNRDHQMEIPPQELFIGEPRALKGLSYAISGWPNWLIPTYQLKGHRPEIHLLEEEA